MEDDSTGPCFLGLEGRIDGRYGQEGRELIVPGASDGKV